VGAALLLAAPSMAVAATVSLAASESATPSVEPTPTPLPVWRLEDDDLRTQFGGAWVSGWLSTASGQTYRTSTRQGAWARASFEGTGVAFVTRRGPDRGRAKIYVDGVVRATVSLYSSAAEPSRVVWRSDALAQGRHEVKVVVLGSKVVASKGYFVPVDAFEITGTPVAATVSGTIVNNGSSKLVKLGTWATSSRSGPYGGSSWRSSGRGATIIVRFKGTSIAWLGRKDANSGKAAVYLDGKRVATVSQYRSSTSERRVAWARSGLSSGEHTLQIRVLAEKSTANGGTKVDLDAFCINGTLLQAYRPTPFSYPWSTYIVIDKSSFKLYWVRKGLLIKTYPIAHGKSSTPTPSRVWRIDAKYYTDPSSVYGPRKMRLFKRVKTSSGYRYDYTGYAIHGTNQPWVIGTKASHGCIRMYNSDVLQLFPQVPLGTMVVTRD
jgi:hypothetical protein